MNQFPRLFLLILVLVLASCDPKSDGGSEEFDRAAFLQNVVQDFIIADFQSLQTATATLSNSVLSLVNSPNQTELNAAREAFIEAVLIWQRSNAYNFGPAAEQGLTRSLNEEIATFPISVEKMETRLTSGSFSFTDFDRDARGFYAVGYLLYGVDKSDQQIIDAFGDEAYRLFTIGAVEDINNRVSSVFTAWDTETQNAFVSNDGTDAGSSISSYFNEYVKSFEALKNFKLGLPLGLRAGQTSNEPDRIEARFSGISFRALETDFLSVRRTWEGTSGENGFQFYLQSVTGGDELIASTITQFEAVQSAFDAIEDTANLRDLIINEDARLVTLHTELQKLTRFLKSDMSSLMGIAITFASGDGD